MLTKKEYIQEVLFFFQERTKQTDKQQAEKIHLQKRCISLIS